MKRRKLLSVPLRHQPHEENMGKAREEGLSGMADFRLDAI